MDRTSMPDDDVRPASTVLDDLAALAEAAVRAEARIAGLGQHLRALAHAPPVAPRVVPTPGGIAVRVITAASILLLAM